MKNIQQRRITSFERPENVQSTQAMKSIGKYYTSKMSAENAKANVAFRNYISLVKKEAVKAIYDYKQKKITADTLRVQLKNIIGSAHKESFLSGLKAAGVDDPDKREKRWVRDSANHELNYLDKMIDDAVSGKGLDPVQRIQRFIPALQASFASGRQQAMPRDNIIIHWRLEGAKPDGKNCKTCLELSKLSPFTPSTLPFVPRSGKTLCLFNCRCGLIYQFESNTDKLQIIENKQKSSFAVIAYLKKKKVMK